jgi:hypothetical protein
VVIRTIETADRLQSHLRKNLSLREPSCNAGLQMLYFFCSGAMAGEKACVFLRWSLDHRDAISRNL